MELRKASGATAIAVILIGCSTRAPTPRTATACDPYAPVGGQCEPGEACSLIGYCTPICGRTGDAPADECAAFGRTAACFTTLGECRATCDIDEQCPDGMSCADIFFDTEAILDPCGRGITRGGVWRRYPDARGFCVPDRIVCRYDIDGGAP